MSGIEPANIAKIDQRIAHGHEVLATIVKSYQELLAEHGHTAAVGILVTILNGSLTQKPAAIDLLVVAVIELSDRQEETPR